MKYKTAKKLLKTLGYEERTDLISFSFEKQVDDEKYDEYDGELDLFAAKIEVLFLKPDGTEGRKDYEGWENEEVVINGIAYVADDCFTFAGFNYAKEILANAVKEIIDLGCFEYDDIYKEELTKEFGEGIV